MLVALAIEHFGCMPDELAEWIDRTAHRTGTTEKRVLAELVAHFELKDQDRRAAQLRAKADAYKNR